MAENTSGRGKSAVIPEEIQKWNWGAFFFNFIWGLFNQTFISLLMLVPFLNMVMPFVLGAKGSEWAWQNKRWESVEHFKKVQRIWAYCGLGIFIIMIAMIPIIFFSVFAIMKSSGAYQMALEKVTSHQKVVALLGEPIEPGFFVSGSVNTSGPSGQANLSFSISGPHGDAKVYVFANKETGEWKILRLAVVSEEKKMRIWLIR